MQDANTGAIATCSPRLETFILDFGDLSASTGMRFAHEPDEDYHYPRDIWSAHRVRMTAGHRAAGIDAIHGPLRRLPQRRGLSEADHLRRCLGSRQQVVHHPNPITLTIHVFPPSGEEIKQAPKMVGPYYASVAKGAAAGRKGAVDRRGPTSRCWIGRRLLWSLCRGRPCRP